MNLFVKNVFFAVLLFTFQKAMSKQDKINQPEFKGYIKDMQTATFINSSDSLITSNLIHNRINFKWNFSKHFTTRMELRNRFFYGETVKMIPGFGKYLSADPGYFDLTKLWIDDKAMVGISAFDRASLRYSSDKFSITAGRQRINWGVNTVWNPNDLFNAYNFLDFDYEERPGVDAVRIQYFTKTFSCIELAYKPSKEENQTVVAALYKTNKWKYDFQFLGGLYYQDLVVGGGWAGNIKNAGFKGEAAYFINKKDWNKKMNNLTVSMTMDYSLKNSWYVSLAALYIQNPASVPSGRTTLSTDDLSAKSLMPYRYSFYAGLMKSITPILRGNLAVIYSPKYNSTILFPSLTYNLAENFDLILTAQSLFSDQNRSVQRSVNSIYLIVRWSF